MTKDALDKSYQRPNAINRKLLNKLCYYLEKEVEDKEKVSEAECSINSNNDDTEIRRLLETLGVVPSMSSETEVFGSVSSEDALDKSTIIENRPLDIRLFRASVLSPCTTLFADDDDDGYKDVMLSSLQGEGEMANRPLAG